MASLICDRCIGSHQLHPDVIPMAACNPYCLKPRARATPGLAPERRAEAQGMDRLVYTVHPLPEKMMNHVWWVQLGHMVGQWQEGTAMGRSLHIRFQT